MSHSDISPVIVKARRTERNLRSALKPFDINVTQFLILAHLNENPATPTEVCRAIEESVELVTMMTRSLKQRNFIDVQRTPDGRKRLLFLTSRGTQTFNKVAKAVEGAEL